MSNAWDRFLELRGELDQRRLAFLKSEVELCETFLRTAETHRTLGNLENARKSLHSAETGYATVRQFLADPEWRVDADTRKALSGILDGLREALDRFKLRLPA